MRLEAKVGVMRGIVWLNRVLCLVALLLICIAVVRGEWGVALVLAILIGVSLAALRWFRRGPIDCDAVDPEGAEAVRARVLGVEARSGKSHAVPDNPDRSVRRN